MYFEYFTTRGRDTVVTGVSRIDNRDPFTLMIYSEQKIR